MRVVRILIEHGSDVNCQDKFGMTPLHHACRSYNQCLAEILLDNGADITIRDCDHRTALEYAALKSGKVMEVLLKKCPGISRQAKIDAYELNALTYDCPDSYKYLLKAMRLRRKYRIPKVADPPSECYNSIKECERFEELRLIENSQSLITINSLLARERILKDKCYDLFKDMDRDGKVLLYLG